MFFARPYTFQMGKSPWRRSLNEIPLELLAGHGQWSDDVGRALMQLKRE